MNKSQARAKLGYGYASPIAGAAVGVVTSLMLNDALPNEYSAWTLVVVQFILGTSLVMGTRYAASARSYELATKQSINARGAQIMNFVLSIIWSAVMGILALVMVTVAVQKLRYSEWITDAKNEGGYEKVTYNHITVDIFMQDWLPAILIMLAFVIGTLLWLVNRAKETE